MAAAGIPRIRFYDLRHCHGTLLASSGVNLKVIKERMGHSAEAFTLSRVRACDRYAGGRGQGSLAAPLLYSVSTPIGGNRRDVGGEGQRLER